jgi:hypothetical protein
MRTRVLATIAILFLNIAVRAQEPGKPAEAAPGNQAIAINPAQPADGAANVNARVKDEIQNRVKELIRLINQEPNVMMVNPKAQTVKDSNWKPVTPDGKYNQDYKVVPDDSNPEISQAVNIQQNRQKWTNELIGIGMDAVPEVVKGVLEPGNKYRYYLVYALGQIRDLHATPAVLKYYSDAVEREKLAKSMDAMGAKDDAEKMRKDSAFEKQTALNALKTLSNQDFGDDYKKWETWWKETEKKIGKVDLPVLYDAKGADPKVIPPSQPTQQYK